MKSHVLLLGLAVNAVAARPNMIKREVTVLGGQDARMEDFPHHADLLIKGEHCGGTILDKRTILTASHCLKDLEPRQVVLRVGSSHKHGGSLYSVASFIRHPKYETESKDYDIAVLKLAKDVAFSSTVKPIGAISASRPVGDSIANVSGHGVLNESGHRKSAGLQYVSVPVFSREGCRGSYRTGVVTDRMLCAGEEGKDTCFGDSGGGACTG